MAKINGSGWKFALIFLSGLIIAAQLVFIIYWRWHSNSQRRWKTLLPQNWVAIQGDLDEGIYDEDPTDQFVGAMEKVPSAEKNSTNSRRFPPKPRDIIQELVCSKIQDNGCYVITDSPSKFGRSPRRSLVQEPLFNIVIAEADLVFPNKYHFVQKETRNWPVRQDQVTMDYQKLIVAQPFVTKTLSPDVLIGGNSISTKRILLAGLHGSTLNNFFANVSAKFDVTVVEPVAALKYIAEKWFGLEEDDHHRVLIEDPSAFLKRHAEALKSPTKSLPNAKKFDVIIVDVCYSSTEHDASCPTSEFSDPNVVESLRKNLSNNGTISINIFSPAAANVQRSNTPKRLQLARFKHELLSLYRKHFGECFFVKIEGANSVLTCVPGMGPMNQKEYMLGMKQLPVALQTFSDMSAPRVLLDVGVLRDTKILETTTNSTNSSLTLEVFASTAYNASDPFLYVWK